MDRPLLQVMQQVWLWEEPLPTQATFVINQPAVDSGSVVNVVSVAAETPSGEDVSADNTDTPVVVTIVVQSVTYC